MQLGPFLIISAIGEIAIKVKKWIDKRKDQDISQGSLFYNNTTKNEAMLSIGQSILYIIFLMVLTLLPYILKFFDEVDSFVFIQIIILTINDLFLPSVYIWHHGNIRKFLFNFINNNLEKWFKNTIEPSKAWFLVILIHNYTNGEMNITFIKSAREIYSQKGHNKVTF